MKAAVGSLASAHFRRTPISAWDAIAASVVAGTSRATIAFVGDSTTAGFGATASDSGYGNGYINSYPAQIASILTRRGLPARFSSAFNFQDVLPSAHPTWNSQLSFGGSWTVDATVKSLGSSMIRWPAASTVGVLAFTPVDSFDTIDVWYIKFGSNGSFTTKVDGGSSLGTTTTSTANANGELVKATFTVSAGTHTVQLTPLNNGDVYIFGIDTYTAGTKQVSCWNLGWGGSKAAQYGATGTFIWTPKLAIAAINPDLTVFNCTINDWVANTTIATYKTQMQTFITAALSVGDVILQTGAPSDTSSASVAQQATFIAAVKELGVTNSCRVIDMTARFGSKASNSAWYFDALHPAQEGYRQIAEAVAPFIY